MEANVVESTRHVRINLYMSEHEEFNLVNAISEATGYVDNWRADPTPLWKLLEVLNRDLRDAN